MASLIAPIASGLGSLFSGIFGGANYGKATNQAVAGLNQGIGTLQGGQTSALNALTSGAGAASSALTSNTAAAGATLSPYSAAGLTGLNQLVAGLSPGGQFTQGGEMTPDQILAQNPGYNFQLEQGQQAIQRGAAAQGTNISGGELKDLTSYSQGLAQTAYQQAFQNYQQVQNQNFSRLQQLAGIGQTASSQISGQQQELGQGLAAIQTGLGTQSANVDLSTASSISKLQDLIGATQAAGTLGQSNALTGGITGALGSLGQLSNLAGGLGNVWGQLTGSGSGASSSGQLP